MYIPKNFLIEDHSEIVAFMKSYSFGTIISIKDSLPIATHLPFIITVREDKIILMTP